MTDAPLDLGTDAFYPSRKKLIESMLEDIRICESLDSRLEEAWVRKGTQCVGVNWDSCDLHSFKDIATCVGGRVLAGMFKLFAEDYSGWSAG